MRKNCRGFTVGELLAVIAIIAVLAAILIPVFLNAHEKAKFADKVNSAKSFKELQSLVGKPYVQILGNVADQRTPEGHRRYYYHEGLKAGVEIDSDTTSLITYVGPWRLPERSPEKFWEIVAGSKVEDASLTVTSAERGTFIIRFKGDSASFLQTKPPAQKAEAEPAKPKEAK